MAFPNSEEEVDALLQIWALKAPSHQAQFGLSAAQITQISDDSIVYSHLRLCRQIIDDESSEFSAYKTDLMEGDPNGTASPYPTILIPDLPDTLNPPKPGIEKRNTALYNYFKNHPSRTDEALADMGILDAPLAAISLADLKPVIGGTSQPDDKVAVTFKKQGQTAVRLFRRRNGGDWETTGDPTVSPYIDQTASVGGNPEKREYRAICLKANVPVGQYSDIVTVYTTP